MVTMIDYKVVFTIVLLVMSVDCRRRYRDAAEGAPAEGDGGGGVFIGGGADNTTGGADSETKTECTANVEDVVDTCSKCFQEGGKCQCHNANVRCLYFKHYSPGDMHKPIIPNEKQMCNYVDEEVIKDVCGQCFKFMSSCQCESNDENGESSVVRCLAVTIYTPGEFNEFLSGRLQGMPDVGVPPGAIANGAAPNASNAAPPPAPPPAPGGAPPPPGAKPTGAGIANEEAIIQADATAIQAIVNAEEKALNMERMAMDSNERELAEEAEELAQEERVEMRAAEDKLSRDAANLPKSG